MVTPMAAPTRKMFVAMEIASRIFRVRPCIRCRLR
jgi:hypothetical protein